MARCAPKSLNRLGGILNWMLSRGTVIKIGYGADARSSLPHDALPDAIDKAPNHSRVLPNGDD